MELRPPRLYREFSSWWALLSPPSDYTEEAAFYRAALLEACERPARTLLEFGSGGGNNASFLKEHFRCVLVDRSPEMLEVSRRLNPECEHVEGDMRSVRLGRRFDLVFVHDAVSYMATTADLRALAATVSEHCEPGGAALFAPDYTKETFQPGTGHGGTDGGGRGLRYLEWTWDPDPTDSTYTVDFALLLRDSDGTVRVEKDRHTLGLFGEAEWLRVIGEAGFGVSAVPYPPALAAGKVFVAKKRA